MFKHAENLLNEVLRFETPPSQILSHYFKDNRQLGSRDRAALSDIVYKVLREKSSFEHLVKMHGSDQKKEKLLAILGWQGDPEWMGRLLTEEELKWLAEMQNITAESLPADVTHNMPEWLLNSLKEQLGDDYIAAAHAFLNTAPLDLRVNLFKHKRDQVLKVLCKSGIKAQATPHSAWGIRIQEKLSLTEHPLYLDGTVEIQEEGSQLLAILLGAKRNDVVVDYCAGAGGKALAIGAAMRNTGRVYAWDIVAYRLSALKPRLERSGLRNIFTAVLSHGEEERVRRLYGKADRVLVDAPCSGLGTIRRSPELKWRQTEEIVQDLTQVQSMILNDACKLVRDGGLLVYATCSFLPEENEAIAQAFTKQHPDFELLNMQALLESQKVKDSHLLVSQEYLRLWPHLHHTDAFFAAAWRKK